MAGREHRAPPPWPAEAGVGGPDPDVAFLGPGVGLAGGLDGESQAVTREAAVGLRCQGDLPASSAPPQARTGRGCAGPPSCWPWPCRTPCPGESLVSCPVIGEAGIRVAVPGEQEAGLYQGSSAVGHGPGWLPCPGMSHLMSGKHVDNEAGDPRHAQRSQVSRGEEALFSNLGAIPWNVLPSGPALAWPTSQQENLGCSSARA